MKKNILIISYSPLHRDPRILRQIQALKDEYEIQTVGFTNPNMESIRFFEITMPEPSKHFIGKVFKGLRIIFHGYNKALKRNCSIQQICSYDYKVPDCIFANDWNGLYAAKVLKETKGWGCKVYFDAHEYFPAYSEEIRWKIFEKPLIKYVFKKSKSIISVMSTVCPSLASMYENFFQYNKGFVKVITNSPDYEADLKPGDIGKKIKLIHHGGAMRTRSLEKMIDMMEFLPPENYELTFMLVKSDKEYYDELVAKAKKYSNIKFIEPVTFNQIPSFTNKFDVGLYILNSDSINHKYALPNKFFEFVQARLAVAIGNSCEMRNYITKYNFGVSAKSNEPKDLAEEILKLSKDDIVRYKQNADKCALELSAERNIEELKRIAEELVK